MIEGDDGSFELLAHGGSQASTATPFRSGPKSQYRSCPLVGPRDRSRSPLHISLASDPKRFAPCLAGSDRQAAGRGRTGSGALLQLDRQCIRKAGDKRQGGSPHRLIYIKRSSVTAWDRAGGPADPGARKPRRRPAESAAEQARKIVRQSVRRSRIAAKPP
jgi:hypothetical protein